jgi:hypothetical protein
MDVKLPPSDAKNLRETFFEILQDFSTFPAAQNFFLVSIDNLPASINDETIKKLGMRPFNTKAGIDTNRKVHEKFFGKGGGYMFLASGVDTTTEHNTVNNKGKTINGILPTGPFMESHDYPDNDLDVQFYETNVSVIDGIFRPWIQLYGVYGNIDTPILTANIDIFFLSKQMVTSRKTSFMSMLFGSPGSSSPVVRKIYKYKDCIPYQINDAGVSEYTGDMDTGSISVKWRFSRYEVLTPHVEAPPPPPAVDTKPEPAKKKPPKAKDPTDDIPEAALGGEGYEYDFTGSQPKYNASINPNTPATQREIDERQATQKKWLAGIQQTDVRGKPIAALGEGEAKHTKFNPVKFKKSRDFSNELPLKDQSPKQQKRAYVQALRDQEARKNPLEDPNDPSFGETRGTKPPGP